MRSRYWQSSILHTAILTVIVLLLAECSGGPGNAAPTVRAGAPATVEFDQGQTTRAVPLSSVFTGQNLSFSDPETDNAAVATASIANGTLTITAGSPGEATITVTARNAGGNISHEIAVTVPATSAPAAPTVRAGAPAAVEFDQGQTTRTVSLNSVFTGQNLTFSAPETDNAAVATASIANGTLTITAGSPGEATITVTARNAGGNISHEIMVIVPATSAPAAPTVRAGAPATVEFDQGQTTRTVSLSSVFTGQNLTFSAPETDNAAVATASIANGTLTITAGSPGEATITVTARNAGGNISHEIAVTVPAMSAPAAPTVRAGAPATVEFDQGQTTRTVSLNSVFTGQNLTFSDPETDNAAVATASIANGTLTITAGSPGEATITVTARNAGGNISHEFAVAVSGSATTPTSSTLTIKLGESAKRTLSSGQTLQPPASGGVKVERSPDGETDNVWLITAKKKGIHRVTILSAGKPVDSITVEVPNSRPLREDQKDDKDLKNPRILLVADTPKGTVLLNGADEDDTPVPLDDYFTDADEEDEEYYRIENKPPWFLIDTENGFVKDADGSTDGIQLSYEVLQEIKNRSNEDYEFTITLYASDGEEESTRPVVIEFNVGANLLPEAKTYDVIQDADSDFRDGSLFIDDAPKNSLMVGPRIGEIHTLRFKGDGRFAFAVTEANELKQGASPKLPSNHQVAVTPGTNVYYKDEGAAPKDHQGVSATLLSGAQTAGTDYFLIKSSGAVVVEASASKAITQDATNIFVPFKLEKGSSGRIVVEYHVWLGTDTSAPPTTSKTSVSKTLTIDIVTCSSPPNPISDCP